MEIAMLLIGLLLGGCVTMCIVSGIALNRYNDYESEIRRLKARLEAKDRNITHGGIDRFENERCRFFVFGTVDRLKVR